MFSICCNTSFHENTFHFIQLNLLGEIHEKTSQCIVHQLVDRNILACVYSQTIVKILWMNKNEKESYIQIANEIVTKMKINVEWIDDFSTTSLHLLGLSLIQVYYIESCIKSWILRKYCRLYHYNQYGMILQ